MDRLGWGLMAKSTGLVGKSTNYPGTKFQGSLDTSKNEKNRQKTETKVSCLLAQVRGYSLGREPIN